MCEASAKANDLPTGGVDITITCKTSGKPITKSNKYGMFCEDMCGLQQAKVALGALDLFLKAFAPKER